MLSPSVACIMPTADRAPFIPQAIACFLAQTWENRRLLILDDGREAIRHLVPDRPDIAYFQQVIQRTTIGEKRNRLCELAEGSDLIAHWDDDDWSCPERLEIQVQRLKDSGKAVTGFRTMLFVDDQTLWRYVEATPYAVGTSLVYRRDWWAAHRFKHESVAEDNVFVRDARNAGQLDCCPCGPLMFARIHAGNTSKKSLTPEQYRRTLRGAEIPPWALGLEPSSCA